MKKILAILLLSSMYILAEADVVTASEGSLANVKMEISASGDFTSVGRVTVYVETYAGFVQQGSVMIHEDDRGYLYVLQNYGKPIPVLNCPNPYFKYMFNMSGKTFYFNM